MDRRAVLAGAGALGVVVSASGAALADDGWRRYRLTSKIDLSDHSGPIELWVPLAQTAPDYQIASRPRCRAGPGAAIVHDQRYGAPVLRASWSEATETRNVVVEQIIATRDRGVVPAHLTAAERRFWTAALPSMPTSGISLETANRIVAAAGHAPRAKARAIYDWVVDNTFRDAAARGCGIGRAEGMLKSGYMGGKCADINSLFVALCRAEGLPARDVYGVRLGPSIQQASLGARTSDVTHAQHCRAEVWLEREGWLPADPADVRKVVLDANLPLTSPEVKAERERLFGNWEMNWAGYNSATDIVLPGAAQSARENFLMYPLAVTAAGELDQLSPERFRYRLTSVPA